MHTCVLSSSQIIAFNLRLLLKTPRKKDLILYVLHTRPGQIEKSNLCLYVSDMALVECTRLRTSDPIWIYSCGHVTAGCAKYHTFS
jgi:hypothetical protein